MFYNCESLNMIDISSFNSHNIRGMCRVFEGCKSLSAKKIITNDKKLLKYLK